MIGGRIMKFLIIKFFLVLCFSFSLLNAQELTTQQTESPLLSQSEIEAGNVEAYLSPLPPIIRNKTVAAIVVTGQYSSRIPIAAGKWCGCSGIANCAKAYCKEIKHPNMVEYRPFFVRSGNRCGYAYAIVMCRK